MAKIEIDCIDPKTPVTGCGCDRSSNLTFGECESPDDAVLTPGDPSPAGRCPDCGGLVYADTPDTRAADAFSTFLWSMRRNQTDPAARRKAAADLEEAINAALADAFTAVEVHPKRGTYTVNLADCDGDTFTYYTMARSPLEAGAIAWGIRRADGNLGADDTAETFKMLPWALDEDSEGWGVDAIYPCKGGADLLPEIAEQIGLTGQDRYAEVELGKVLAALPPFDNAQAETEGWSLLPDEDGALRIRSTVFTDHNAATFHVLSEAAKESGYHALAVALVGTARQE